MSSSHLNTFLNVSEQDVEAYLQTCNIHKLRVILEVTDYASPSSDADELRKQIMYLFPNHRNIIGGAIVAIEMSIYHNGNFSFKTKGELEFSEVKEFKAAKYK